jgi:hypothetical protein
MRATLRELCEDLTNAKHKAMPLTKVNDIAFAYLGAGAERWKIN